MTKNNKTPLTRRGLMKGAAAAAAVVGVGCSDQRGAAAADAAAAGASSVTGSSAGGIDMSKYSAPPVAPGKAGTGRVLGANDRIRIAVIGVGGQGYGSHVVDLMKHADKNNIEVVGACDLYAPRRDRAEKKIKEKVPTAFIEKDYRKLLDNKDIDAVVVATPEHWHAPISIHAMEAGKHVYCEKPVSRHLNEAFELVDAQKRTGKVFQLGIQYTSDPKLRTVGKFLQDGKIGPIVSGQSSYCRNAGRKGEWNYKIDDKASPENLDWETWLGYTTKRPWNDDAKERFFRYRKYWDYSGGILGDLLPHRLGPFLVASGKPEFPTRVTCLGTRNISLDREVDDNVQVMAEFPSGWTMLLTGSTVNEQGLPDLFRGLKGTVYFSGESAVVKPERPFAEELEEKIITKEGIRNVEIHHANWIKAMRGEAELNCPVDFAAKVQSILCLAEISRREGRMMHFDEKTRKITAG